MKEFDPGDNAASIVSVTDRVRPVALGMAVTSVHFLGDRAAFVGAEESVALVSSGEISPVAVHSGGILCAASDGSRIVMGGDDGKLVALDAPLSRSMTQEKFTPRTPQTPCGSSLPACRGR